MSDHKQVVVAKVSERRPDWPKVLVLSAEIPEASSAGGLLLYRLFQDYPHEQICVIGRQLEPDVPRLNSRYEVLQTPWIRFEYSRFNRFKRSLRGIGLVPVASSRQVKRLLNGFNPEIVVTVMQFSRFYDCAYRYARSNQLPLVTIVHDVNEEFEKVQSWATLYVRNRDREFYSYCSLRLCVSPEMESLCADLYGVRGDVMYPNRSEDLLPRDLPETLRVKSNSTFTIGFVGNLNYGYGSELVKMLPVLRKYGCQLVIFSHPPGTDCAELLEATDCIDFRGFVPAMQAWEAVKRECDAVLLAYPNPAGRMERLYRHHFPSKLPEYLALGMPVIITGPEFATGVKWGLQNPEAAITCIEPDLSDFAESLDMLITSPERRLSFAAAALRVGDIDFDPLKIRNKFFQRLRELAPPTLP